MKYFVRLGHDEVPIEIEGERARVGDQELAVHLDELPGTPVRVLRVGDAVHRVVVKRGERRGELTLWVAGHRFDVEALDERTRAIRELAGASKGHAGPAPIVAPMPGLIVRISAAVGDRVQPGQGLVVMEAMKMENELRATSGGTVKSVHVAAGTAVEKGTLLLELE
jgi:biotin carboxyl carrier protein